jgi:two-component system cell cycle sensor histidine kinase/response regulator CckA
MAMQGLSTTMGERNERRGSIALVLLVAVGLIVAAAGLMLVGRNQAGSYVMFLLAVLGMIGVFSLFALAAGVLRISGREASNSTLEQVVEHAHEGIVVTDANGRVLYANATYRAFSGATGTQDIRPVERVFVGDPDVAEAVYRLLRASRDGRRLQEEVRITSRGGRRDGFGCGASPWGWGTRRTGQASVWIVADVTRDRERQENVFRAAACDRLSRSAPAGFFRRWQRRHGYIDAALAGWLDYDPPRSARGLRLPIFCPATVRRC